jgi:dTMP kinase
VIGALGVGIGAGMAFLSGTTLLGKEVTDDVRGRVFAFIQTGTQVTLLLTISLSSFIVGLGGVRRILGFTMSTTRPMLFAAGVFGIVAGLIALRQMDDRPGVPLLADVIGSLRGRPLGADGTTLPSIAAEGRPLPGAGLLIVFEGGEGSGKSTQVERLAEALRSYGRTVVVTREPGATTIGARIREIVLDRPGAHAAAPLAPRAEALLYAADRAHHVATVIGPALRRGAIVISDRFVDSSLAYQGAGRTLPHHEVRWLSSWATGGLRPDLVVLLDIDPSVGLARAAARSGQDRVEAESLAFHQRVRTAFRELAAAEPDRYLIVDADDPVDVIAFAIRERVHRLLPSTEVRLPAGAANGRTAPVAGSAGSAAADWSDVAAAGFPGVGVPEEPPGVAAAEPAGRTASEPVDAAAASGDQGADLAAAVAATPDLPVSLTPPDEGPEIVEPAPTDSWPAAESPAR